jgi:hypothetical protein
MSFSRRAYIFGTEYIEAFDAIPTSRLIVLPDETSLLGATAMRG